ncbi:unnamed protein product [Citrullus colocynthis]|uniref:Uncharacterized protein n=1 Tax=Citrullus colocynthis TaxID=252529 RepID=A0ABP0Z609_9ROSI
MLITKLIFNFTENYCHSLFFPAPLKSYALFALTPSLTCPRPPSLSVSGIQGSVSPVSQETDRFTESQQPACIRFSRISSFGSGDFNISSVDTDAEGRIKWPMRKTIHIRNFRFRFLLGSNSNLPANLINDGGAEALEEEGKS